MMLDGLGWSLMIFRNHIFVMIFQILSPASPGGECFAPPPSSRGSAPSSRHVVRSTLLQVTGARQIGQRGFLLLGFRWPFWPTLSRANFNQMNHFRFESLWFLMPFPMVSSLFIENDGIIPNIGTLGENHENSWKFDDHKINPGSFRWCLGVIRKQ